MNATSLLCVMLTVLFIGLKLTGYIAWSWWLVLLPLYVGLVVALVLIVVLIALVYVVEKFSQ